MKDQREAGFLMAKIHQVSGRIFNRKLKDYKIEELNPAQGRIMFVLWREDGIPIQELAKKTSLGKSTLTSMLDRLENTGFIKRVHSDKDRRIILIFRTEKDKAFQNLYAKVSTEMNDLYFKDFTKEEMDDYESYLRRIFENLILIEKSMK